MPLDPSAFVLEVKQPATMRNAKGHALAQSFAAPNLKKSNNRGLNGSGGPVVIVQTDGEPRIFSQMTAIDKGLLVENRLGLLSNLEDSMAPLQHSSLSASKSTIAKCRNSRGRQTGPQNPRKNKMVKQPATMRNAKGQALAQSFAALNFKKSNNRGLNGSCGPVVIVQTDGEPCIFSQMTAIDKGLLVENSELYRLDLRPDIDKKQIENY
ncbi:hypothetical protein O9G_005557 [Rozella allomycis CSF55]|uniref:Uncharacterized protein n=1 Tax=Rozella allomycis (strain CSF55) TaxID=988480 RepID=A0A075B2K2_ROZAC|nr:hypothetical protein O9G_005557 [Rozella allomycis CSF55]|eukprot:EPZ36782.1 hypothetical protein O9G_005557 [Rozella allomycis CSF55]